MEAGYAPSHPCEELGVLVPREGAREEVEEGAEGREAQRARVGGLGVGNADGADRVGPVDARWRGSPEGSRRILAAAGEPPQVDRY